MKKILVPVVVVASCLALGGALAVGCVISRGVSWASSWNSSEKATRNETQPVPIREGEELEIALGAGDLEVQAGSSDAPELVALVTAYGRDVETAKRVLDATHLVVEPRASKAGGARIRIDSEGIDQGSNGVRVVVTPRVDVKLRLPKDVRITAELGSGTIRVHGPIGASKMKSSYGDVRVDEASGDLAVESASGRVEVGTLRAATDFTAKSSYGSVSARHVEAANVTMHSSSGDVRLEDAKCTRVELASSYGEVAAVRVHGELSAKTSSGDVQVEELEGSAARLESGYGDVVLRGFRGKLRATTSSGNVEINGFEGDCEASSGYGHVRVEGVLTRFDGHSQSGSVRANALAGSELASDWKLTSGYGDVTLEVPKTLGFELAAKSGYGTLDVQVPVMVEAGALKDKKSVRGKVGAGGKRVDLSTSSGDVHVLARD